jgi:hypothetical protein
VSGRLFMSKVSAAIVRFWLAIVALSVFAVALRNEMVSP